MAATLGLQGEAGSTPVTAPSPEAPLPSAGAAARSWRHIPALDGFRGVAVAAVLLYHGGFAWARGGFLGVDAFFVLSGFLITSLLLDETARTGTIALARFWGRRARRLLPALLLVVGAVAVYAWLFATPDALQGIRRDAIATLGYAANWRYIFAKASYFQRTALPSPLRHTWSLAIEEQFYLVWPLAVLVVARGPRPWLRVGAAAAAAASASVAAMVLLCHPGQDPSRVYYGSDTRANVILIGAALAAIMAVPPSAGRTRRRPAHRAPRRRHSLAAPALGLLALAGATAWVWAVASVDGTAAWLYQGGFPLLALAVAAVIGHAVMVPTGVTARILGIAPLRWLGRISYGVYLWHWPLFLTLTHARTGFGGWALFGVRATATLAVSTLSYLAVELPIRRGRLTRWRAAGALTTALAAAAAAVVLATATVPAAPAAAALTSAGTTTPPGAGGHFLIRRPPRPPGQPARVLVVGDSVGETLVPGLQPAAGRYGLTFQNQGTLGCGLVRGGPYRYFGTISAEPAQCEQWPQRWARNVVRGDPDLAMVVIGRWEVMDRVYNGRWTHIGDPAFDSYLESEIDHAITVLSSNGARVVFLSAPYFLRGERPDGGRWPEDDPARVDQFNGLLRDVTGRRSDVASVIDFGEHTSVGGRYTPVIDGVGLRYDGVHFTVQAAHWLTPWLLPQLVQLVPPINPALAIAVTAPTPTTLRYYRTATTAYRPSTTTSRPATTTATTTRSSSTTSPSTTVVQVITHRTVPATTTTVAGRR